MLYHLRKSAAASLLLGLTLALSACAGEPEQKEGKTIRKATQAQPKGEVEKPSPEELANQPCGNPDWAQLPEGAEDKAPAEGDEAGEETDEQSSARLYPDSKPCT